MMRREAGSGKREAGTARVALATKRKGAAPLGSGALTMELSLARRMPAEWEKHDATWIAWPHHEPDWPGKLAPIPWVYAEIVRALSEFERVEILCHNPEVADNARRLITAHGVPDHPDKYRLHIAPNDRVWLRDSAPTFVYRADGVLEMINWASMAGRNTTTTRATPKSAESSKALPVCRGRKQSGCLKRPEPRI